MRAHIRRFGLQAFEQVPRGGPGPPELGAEAERRREYWRTRAQSALQGRAASRAGYGLAAMIVSTSIMLGGAAWLFVGVAAAYVLWNARGSRRWSQLSDQIVSGLCPLCRYDVRGLAPAGCPLGPARCPECGAPWPLIPPACPARRA